jgi:Ca2+/H+ antiporter, TMEM165/GDT1 family
VLSIGLVRTDLHIESKNLKSHRLSYNCLAGRCRKVLAMPNIGVLFAALGTASVEFFEVAVIAYAISRSGYKREAVWGSLAGLVGVGLPSFLFSSSLQSVPIHWLQLTIGMVLLWFGWGWTKKSVLRQAQGKRAGWVAEDPLLAEGIALQGGSQGFSYANFLIVTKSAALEAFEVALAVVALGLASNAWSEALWGTSLALFLTVGATLLLHGHMQRVPDVVIKLSAGVMLLSFGSFWLGEGLGLEWPGSDLSLIGLVMLYAGLSFLAIRWLERGEPSQSRL